MPCPVRGGAFFRGVLALVKLHMWHEQGARCRSRREPGAALCALLVALSMVSSLLCPTSAFASIFNNPTVRRVGATNGYYVFAPNNRFDAALALIGETGKKIQLDSGMFAKLSNEGSGGDFYDLAQKFFTSDGPPSWIADNGLWYSQWGGDKTMVGVQGGNYATDMWYVQASSDEISAARRDFNVILGGGSLGGGGGASADTYMLTLQESGVVRTNNQNIFFKIDGVRYAVNDYKIGSEEGIANAPKTLTFDFSNAESRSLVEDRLSRGWHLYVYAYPGPASGSEISSPLYYNVLLCNTTASIYPVDYSVGNVTWRSTNIRVDYDDSKSYYIAKSQFGADYSASMTWVDSDSFTIDAKLNHVTSASQFNSAGFASPRSNGRNVYINYEVSGPTLPPNNNWPTDDPTPTPPDPPEVPGPTDDPIPQPDPPDLPNPVQDPVTDPYTPDPDPPSNPVITYDPNPTGEPTDYRPWLNAILVLLRKINTTISDGFGDLRGYLTTHCDHIREQIHDDTVSLGLKFQAAISNAFVSFERWLQGTYTGYFFEMLDYSLSGQLQGLEDYLYELFHWLAEQFDFDGGGYDDSSVIYWLRQIYGKLMFQRTGPGGNMPTEREIETGFDFWEWVFSLLDQLFDGLVSELVGDVGSFLEGFSELFPFSVPWDLQLALVTLGGVPVTPHFTFDIPMVGTDATYTIDVDLEPYDNLAATVRTMEAFVFAFMLAMKSKWLLDFLWDATQGAVTYFDGVTE